MPITEVPTNQAPPEPPRIGSRNVRYDDLNTTDLLHAIDDLEQANSWGRVREMIWISIIIHLLILWYIVYGQKYIHLPAVHVVTEQQQLKQHPKQLTYLQLPKDLLKQPKPRHTNRISNQNRIAEAPHPIQKPKTAAQIEAMRRAGQQMHAPPAAHRKPAPTQRPRPQMRKGQQAQKPQPHPQQSAPRPRTPPAQPLPSSNLSKLMAPQPRRVQNFRRSPMTPGQQIQQALRAASQGGFNGAGAPSGDDGLNAPVQHQGIQGSVNILSDTRGVNFYHYIQMVIAATKRAWYPIIPEEARPPINKSGIVEIRFIINADGNVTGMQLYGPSGDVALDRAAWGGITGATPFPPLPKQFVKNGGKHLALQFNFLYNENPDQ